MLNTIIAYNKNTALNWSKNDEQNRSLIKRKENIVNDLKLKKGYLTLGDVYEALDVLIPADQYEKQIIKLFGWWDRHPDIEFIVDSDGEDGYFIRTNAYLFSTSAVI